MRTGKKQTCLNCPIQVLSLSLLLKTKSTKKSYLLRELLYALEVLVEVPVDLGQLDDGARVLALKVLVDVLAEALPTLAEGVQLTEGRHTVVLQLQALAQANDVSKELDLVVAQGAVHPHELREKEKIFLQSPFWVKLMIS